MSLYISGLLLVAGGVFIFLAALGVYRMPDVYAKCHASSKASTLGKILVFCSLAVFFASYETTFKSLLIIIFFFFTVPVGTHLIARAAHAAKAKQVSSTVFDDFKD